MNKIDKKVKEYLERATEIGYSITKGETGDYEAHLVRVVEIAKMVQREEHRLFPYVLRNKKLNVAKINRLAKEIREAEKKDKK